MSEWKKKHKDHILVYQREWRKKNKDRFCLLIIDNVMKLKENTTIKEQTKADDTIMFEVDDWNIKTDGDNACVFLLHHTGKGQTTKWNENTAFKPREDDLKGSTRYRESATKVMLINSMANYPEIQDMYPHIPNLINRLSIIEVVKNRFDKLVLMRYLAYPEYNHFVSLNKLNKNAKK